MLIIIKLYFSLLIFLFLVLKGFLYLICIFTYILYKITNVLLSFWFRLLFYSISLFNFDIWLFIDSNLLTLFVWRCRFSLKSI